MTENTIPRVISFIAITLTVWMLVYFNWPRPEYRIVEKDGVYRIQEHLGGSKYYTYTIEYDSLVTARYRVTLHEQYDAAAKSKDAPERAVVETRWNIVE